jgi:hypothetical protein
MRLSVPSLALLSILPTSLAAPAPAPAPVVAGIAPIPTPGPSTEQVQSLDERQLLNNVIPGLLPGVISLVDNLLGDVNEAVAQGNPTKVLSILSHLPHDRRISKPRWQDIPKSGRVQPREQTFLLPLQLK